jgi:5-methylcytosine-specific restriction protein B
MSVDVDSVDLNDVCRAFSAAVKESGLDYWDFDSGSENRHSEMTRVLVVSLATKRLVLLTGLSGSGKTRLALAFGQWLGKERWKLIPVRPDWTGPDALLGYEDGLSTAREGRLAWRVPEALEFMLTACRDASNPYLLLLDEMNLAHVERYFADVLSGMESATDVLPNVHLLEGEWRITDPDRPKIPFPKNLWVVGTVNIDETTYMFSPKVLDRSNTIEFRVSTDNLVVHQTSPKEVTSGSAILIRRFIHDSFDSDLLASWDDLAKMSVWLKDLHRLLTRFDREFGHRAFFEALRFGALLARAGDNDPLRALDLQVMQKVLPRLHGSIRQISEPLAALGEWCFYGPETRAIHDPSFDPERPPADSAVLPISFAKVQRMTRRLRANHFVSFAE